MKELLDTKGAAVYTRLAVQTLAKMRGQGGGPPFYKIGSKICYAISELDIWLDEKRRRSTSDTGSQQRTQTESLRTPKRSVGTNVEFPE